MTPSGIDPATFRFVAVPQPLRHRVARWQQSSTHFHTNSTQNTENGMHNNIKKKNWEVWAVPRLCKLYHGICLKTEEKAQNSVRVVEKCPNIPAALVQYTFTHNQYTEQHNVSEYTERNIHNNKNTLS
jgi:hypothetical protein